MRALPGTDRDPALVADQLRRAEAALRTELPPDNFEYVEGIAETLAWMLGQMFEAPGSRQPKQPTRRALMEELPLVGIPAHDRRSPAHHYALGALRTVEWLMGSSERMPVSWSEDGARRLA